MHVLRVLNLSNSVVRLCICFRMSSVAIKPTLSFVGALDTAISIRSKYVPLVAAGTISASTRPYRNHGLQSRNQSGCDSIRLAACDICTSPRWSKSILHSVEASISSRSLPYHRTVRSRANTVLPGSKQNTLTTSPAPGYRLCVPTCKHAPTLLRFRRSIAVSVARKLRKERRTVTSEASLLLSSSCAPNS